MDDAAPSEGMGAAGMPTSPQSSDMDDAPSDGSVYSFDDLPTFERAPFEAEIPTKESRISPLTSIETPMTRAPRQKAEDIPFVVDLRPPVYTMGMFFCCGCGKRILGNRTKHVSKFHGKGRVKHCPVPSCNYTSVHFHRIEIHYKTIHQKIKPFACRICDFRAAQVSDVRRHFFKHMDQRLYKCAHCTMSFKRKISLATHTRRAHVVEWKRAKAFACSWCDNRYSLRRFLVNHISDKHSK